MVVGLQLQAYWNVLYTLVKDDQNSNFDLNMTTSLKLNMKRQPS